MVLVACPGSGSSDKPAQKRDAAPVVYEDGPDPVFEDAPRVEPEPEPVDPGKVISELGAIPAWQAVVDRGQYLARRNLHGVVYGTLGAPIQMADPASDGGLVPSPK